MASFISQFFSSFPFHYRLFWLISVSYNLFHFISNLFQLQSLYNFASTCKQAQLNLRFTQFFIEPKLNGLSWSCYVDFLHINLKNTHFWFQFIMRFCAFHAQYNQLFALLRHVHTLRQLRLQIQSKLFKIIFKLHSIESFITVCTYAYSGWKACKWQPSYWLVSTDSARFIRRMPQSGFYPASQLLTIFRPHTYIRSGYPRDWFSSEWHMESIGLFFIIKANKKQKNRKIREREKRTN